MTTHGEGQGEVSVDHGLSRRHTTDLGSHIMADALSDVLVAGYRDIEGATTDFDTLVAQVKAKAVRIEAAILVTHDVDGEVVVVQTGDHLGRKGAGWGGAVGFLVGLAAPPLLAATVLGGRRWHRRQVRNARRAGSTPSAGAAPALIITTYDAGQRFRSGSWATPAKSVVQIDKSGSRAQTLADAMGKFARPNGAALRILRSPGPLAGRSAVGR
jgi:arylsulfatase